MQYLSRCWVQQLPEYKYDYDFSPSEGITPICKKALNKVLSYDTLLTQYGPENIMPSVDQITKICTATCCSSLIQFEKDVQKACPVETNIIHWPDGSNFTGTDNINEFIDRHNKIQEKSKAEYDESFASAVAPYIETCETTSVEVHIRKGTPTTTGTSSASTRSSGEEITSAMAEKASTETTPTTTPEISVFALMPSGVSLLDMRLISFILPVLVLTSH
ncbi:hypothetical protein N0V84_003904 [Fusarium piperis]|uniref:Uncharacterized protein n=1 Tax=Fusarium piperis TaxID=1435070 RepID=A0A9W8WGQ5_9HYPO|nr:hypothetical protein N0V84_003904 [Fusarium piperis]